MYDEHKPEGLFVGHAIKNQVPVKVQYGDIILDVDLRLDIIVDDKVILELKSVSEIQPVHKKQLLTYMRLTKSKLGYVINFNVDKLRDGGIERIVNHL